MKYETIKKAWNTIYEVGEAIVSNNLSINNAQDAASVFGEIAHKEQEHFEMITLDSGNHVINKYTVHIGTVNKSMVNMRDVFKNAVRDGAIAIVTAHNHPSGNLDMSSSDRMVVNQLQDSGQILGIQILDFLIITKKGYYSHQEAGLL